MPNIKINKIVAHLLFALALLSTITMYADDNQSDNTATMYVERGKKYLEEQNKPIAQAYFKRALTIDPENTQALHYLAATLYYSGHYHEACTVFKKCAAKDPSHAPSQYSLAISHGSIGQFDKAQKILESLQKQNSENEQIRKHLLPIYIRNMDWSKASQLSTPNNLWWHNNNIANQQILLNIKRPKNNLSDVLQMIRYAKHLHEAGANVIVQTDKIYIPLLSLCPYIQKVTDQAVMDSVDQQYYLDINTFMLCMKDTLHEPPKDIPYLYANETLIAKCKSQVWYGTQFKIGINWQGAPITDAFTGTKIENPQPLQPAMLDSLFAINQLSFYTLTKGSQQTIEDLHQQNKNIYALSAMTDSGPFMDPAAIIQNMDLIITVDNFIAHLAGAMGKPVWLLLAKSADCRWFSDRRDSPWYPTMRIFRQEKEGEWESVVTAITTALEELLAKK